MIFLYTIKRLILEKIEDLRDTKEIKKIFEASHGDYVSARLIDSLFDKK